MINFVECLSFSWFRELKTVVQLEQEKVFWGAPQEKVTKTEVLGIRLEEKEGVPVTGQADAEPQLAEDLQKGANGHNLERNFLHLIGKSDFEVIAARSVVTVVTALKSASVEVLNIPWKTSLFYIEKGYGGDGCIFSDHGKNYEVNEVNDNASVIRDSADTS